MISTVGHSNRSRPEFITLLNDIGVKALVDIRSYPSSRQNPQFRQAVLRRALEDAGIQYDWAGHHLGGLRRADARSPHIALSDSLRGYADYMYSPVFKNTVRQLLGLSRHQHVTLMCAERDADRCHRSLLADFLVAGGRPVFHLVAAGVQSSHRLSPRLRNESGKLIYDRNTQTQLLGI
ncbi:MAG: DUF488 domain-containing protein [Gammaproteobacteria bacterium]|nr:DUF488 domain-containing protein [Gammaproteobacteria bacterium]